MSRSDKRRVGRECRRVLFRSRPRHQTRGRASPRRLRQRSEQAAPGCDERRVGNSYGQECPDRTSGEWGESADVCSSDLARGTKREAERALADFVSEVNKQRQVVTSAESATLTVKNV